jgi:hypothetical protein
MDRRVLLATTGSSALQVLQPIAWWKALPQYVVLNGGNVAQWLDISGNANHLSQSIPAAQPQWDTGGWGNGCCAVLFTGSNSLERTTGTLISSASGNNTPNSVLTTVQINVVGDNSIASWDDTTPGSAEAVCRLDNPALNAIRYVRTANSGSSISQTGALQFGSTHVRIMWIFNGSTIRTYLNGVVDLGGGAAGVGVSTFTRFRMGDGPGATDSLFGRMTEMLVVPRAISDAEAQLYNSSALAEWG